MIYVRLMGGLGNQMFQYAFASALSKRFGVNFALDTFFLESSRSSIGFTKRDFELGVFNIQGKLTRINIDSKWRKFFFRSMKGFDFFFEESFSYSNDVSCKKPDLKTFYIGYFQSEKYFLDFSDEIRKELSFSSLPNVETQKLANEMEKNDRSVSLHFRRGDYVSNKDVQNFHGVCDLEYYKKAVSLVSDIDPHLYIFSDDLKWVKENFLTEFKTTYVDINNKPKDSYGDMFLMSKAYHNIIANSSFSWWGAWLNNNPGKKVIAPSRWFATTDVDTSDVLPEGWIKL